VQLKINLNTVNKAYKELEIQEILETQQGSGTFIGTVKVNIPKKERQGKLENICDEFINIASSYGFGIQDIIEELNKRLGGE
jgi:GntR family transcriptional regulator